MENLTLEEQTALFVNGIYAIDKLYDEYAKSVGLTFIGLSVLNVIYEQDGTFTQKFISERTSLPKQSVNVIIRSLWEQGYIEMRELDTDRRNKEIWLSQSGREYAKRIIGKLAEAMAGAFGQLTYLQRQDMIHLVAQITANFKTVIESGAQEAASGEGS